MQVKLKILYDKKMSNGLKSQKMLIIMQQFSAMDMWQNMSHNILLYAYHMLTHTVTLLRKIWKQKEH